MSSNRVVVGRVGRPHGLDGSFIVEKPSDDERWFAVGAELFAGNAPVRVIASRHGSGGRPVIRLNTAVVRGTSLEVAREALPPTEDDEYYVFELIGLEVIEDGGRSLGRVTRIVPGPANDALELDSGDLLPLVGECVRDIDLEAARILIAPGFIDPG